MFFGIKSSENWLSAEPIKKGWSKDEKYLVTVRDGKRLLLRLSDIEKFADKKKEFEIIMAYSETGVRMSMPLEFGVCEGGKKVYMLLSWIEGRDLREVLPELSEDEQYRLGREAGKILRKIHSIPLNPEDIPAKTKKERKLRQLAEYESSNVRIAGDEAVIRFERENIDLIWREKPVYQHGDFHPGNLIYCADGSIGVIDFNRWEVGDPYEEFYKLQSFGREVSVPYCRGQIDAYFNDNVPMTFWETQAVYVAHGSLFSIKWAVPFGQADVDGMVERFKTAYEDYDGFTRLIPRWYQN